MEETIDPEKIIDRLKALLQYLENKMINNDEKKLPGTSLPRNRSL